MAVNGQLEMGTVGDGQLEMVFFGQLEMVNWRWFSKFFENFEKNQNGAFPVFATKKCFSFLSSLLLCVFTVVLFSCWLLLFYHAVLFISRL